MKFLLVFFTLCYLNAKAATPDWFLDYLKTNPECNREYLCAVGEGKTNSEALGEARAEIAKFFQNKIQSKTQLSSSSEQKGLTPATGNVDEWTHKVVSEETSEIINGLEIRKQEQINGHVFVLMNLSKDKTAKILKEKIEALDTENFQLLELNSRFTYPKIIKNLSLIEALNERYILVSQIPLKFRVNKEIIQDKLNRLEPVKLAIVTSAKRLPTKLNHILLDLLSSLRVVVVPAKLSPPYTLRSELIVEEQYFKVNGFKKLNVQFRLELLNSKAQIMGKISALSEQVGRSSDQGIEKAIPDIKEALQNNLYQLSNKSFDE